MIHNQNGVRKYSSNLGKTTALLAESTRSPLRNLGNEIRLTAPNDKRSFVGPHSFFKVFFKSLKYFLFRRH